MDIVQSFEGTITLSFDNHRKLEEFANKMENFIKESGDKTFTITTPEEYIKNPEYDATELEIGVSYDNSNISIKGKHSPATMECPEEYPELTGIMEQYDLIRMFEDFTKEFDGHGLYKSFDYDFSYDTEDELWEQFDDR